MVGILASLVAWTMAGFVLANSRGRPSNRALALLLFLEGAGAGTGNGLMFLTTERADAYAYQAVSTVAYVLVAPVYCLFLSTLDTPLVRPLRTRTARVILAMSALAMVALVLVRTDLFTPRMVQPWYAPWDQESGDAFVGVLGLNAAVGVYALAASISLLRRAGSAGAARKRAKTFIAAFTTRDGIFAVTSLVLPLIPNFVHSKYADVGFTYAFAGALIILLYVPILAYGILKAQLFDIDLRVKRSIQGGSVAAVFVAVFFVIEQVVQNYFSATLGILAGGVAAGVLLFLLAPLQRLAGGFADAALPHVRETPEYVSYRKHEVYRQALRDAAYDGVVTEKDRRVLAGLRVGLGIDERVARELEASALSPPGSTPSASA